MASNDCNFQASIPADVVCLEDYERHFSDRVNADVEVYFQSGCGYERGQQRIRESFQRYGILPRALQHVDQGSTALSLLGCDLASPVLLAPVAHQGLVHPRGELETAAAAEAVGAAMVCSTLSSVALEEIAEVGGVQWFQLYWQGSREETLPLVRRAERCGYRALVLTVDVPVQAMRYRNQKHGLQPDRDSAANLRHLSTTPAPSLEPGDSAVFQGVMCRAPDWQDVQWLLAQTSLPVILKGILNPEDAVNAQHLGVSGVIVSSHGGRAMDSLVPPLAVLTDIRSAVAAGYPVLLDSGIRCGEDVFKALALGADAVLIGRPQIHALAVAGALGVAHMLRVLQEELEVVMSLCGCSRLDQIDRRFLRTTV